MSAFKEHLLCFSILLALFTKAAIIVVGIGVLIWAWL